MQRRQQSRPYASAAIHPGLTGLTGGRRPGHPLGRQVSRRMIIESLVLTFLTFAVIGLIAGGIDKNLSLKELLPAASETSVSYGINPASEPVQQATADFQATMPVSGGELTVYSDSSYSISAKVEGIKPYDDAPAVAVPYDLLLAWGRMSESDVDGKLTWKQEDRRGIVSGNLGGGSGAAVSNSYVIEHVSNNHMVPANDRIRAALETIKPGDMVKIDGRLVDVQIKTGNRIFTLQTSKSRTDQGDGACEVIFVEQIKVNNEYYR